MPPHPAQLEIPALLEECEIRRQRRGGPGGQHRNKVETAIYIKHLPTGIEAGASERRSQEQNRHVAVGRLRLKLAVEHRSELADGEPPSARWTSRLAGGRIHVSVEHEDYAALLAEVMDVLLQHDYDVPPAAARLACSSSQLTKLLRTSNEALATVNRFRKERGLGILK